MDRIKLTALLVIVGLIAICISDPPPEAVAVLEDVHGDGVVIDTRS